MSHQHDQKGTPECAAQHWSKVEKDTVCRFFDKGWTSKEVVGRKPYQCCPGGNQQTEVSKAHRCEWTVDTLGNIGREIHTNGLFWQGCIAGQRKERRNWPRLCQPDLAGFINRPFDILWRPKVSFNLHPQLRQGAYLFIGETCYLTLFI